MATDPAPLIYRNKILRHLDGDIIARLNLEAVQLSAGRPLERSERGIAHLFFIESGVGSMTTTFANGSQVEVGLFGNESVIGVSGLMGVRRSLNRIFMQIGGAGYACKLERAEEEFNRGERFHKLALRYVQMQLTQVTQTAGCNASHELEQRLARWLLLCMDRAGSQKLGLSQEFLGMMLGVQRTTVSHVMGHFRDAGLIDYTRAKVDLLDRQGLERISCECYAVLRDHLENYLEFDEGFTV